MIIERADWPHGPGPEEVVRIIGTEWDVSHEQMLGPTGRYHQIEQPAESARKVAVRALMRVCGLNKVEATEFLGRKAEYATASREYIRRTMRSPGRGRIKRRVESICMRLNITPSELY